jgi:multidrug efflux pump subunit AcrA (membrane-fusion protein)
VKNVLILVLLIASGLGAYFAVKSQLRLTPENVKGRTAKLVRGDLRLPINATGSIRSARRVEIKSEASGEVIEIARQAGDRVKAGDLIIRLNPDEEQRSAHRAKLELLAAEARLMTAEVALQQTATVDLEKAESAIEQLEQSLRLSRFKLTKTQNLQPGMRSEEELLQWDTTVKNHEAQLLSARAELERVKLSKTRAEQDVKQARASLETAQYNLADAEKRLTKTDIVAPLNGIVGDVRVQIGEVIQGGKTTLTGGTVLAVVLDATNLIVRADVDEADIGRILNIAPSWARPGNDGSVVPPTVTDEAGARALSATPLPKITVETFRDKEFLGLIQRVYPEPDARQGVVTYFVDVAILGGSYDVLLPGMRADVSFTSEEVKDVVLCPNEAIRDGPSGGLGVFIPDPSAPPEERLTRFVPCNFGLDNGNFSEVKS